MIRRGEARLCRREGRREGCGADGGEGGRGEVNTYRRERRAGGRMSRVAVAWGGSNCVPHRPPRRLLGLAPNPFLLFPGGQEGMQTPGVRLR